MLTRLLTASAALLMMAGAAMAEDTVESLRQPTIDVCKTSFGSEAPAGSSPDQMCTCLVDGIIKDFGDDAVPMLKVLQAGLNPSQVTEIATLLGLSEADAEAFIKRADAKIDPIQNACMQ